MRRVSVFGSTGSVGCSTVDLILRERECFHVVAISGSGNVDLLASQARELRPEIAVTADAGRSGELAHALAGSGIATAGGREALVEAASRPADWVMSAIVGFAGLEVSLEAAGVADVLALANKESMVCGGALVRRACAASGCRLIPVDSEHSAIFQALPNGLAGDSVEKIILTASGGPFYRVPKEDLEDVTPEQASRHPNWDMGLRISIDSATLFNKSMELIEAVELFLVGRERIEVLVHPQSIVHALVLFTDKGMLAHLGPVDMRHPIGFALNWPERRRLSLEVIDLAEVGSLDFERPDLDRFPALGLADEVIRMGGLSGAVFNGAKERALDLFIERRIGFTDMARHVASVIARHDRGGGRENGFDLLAVGQADSWARDMVDEVSGVT